jgi:hypothetical protein
MRTGRPNAELVLTESEPTVLERYVRPPVSISSFKPRSLHLSGKR